MPGLRLFVVAGRAALVISKHELWRFRLVGSGCIRADVSLHDTQDLKAKLSKFLELPRRRVREVLGIHLRPSGRVVGEWSSFNQFRAELVMSVHCSLSVKRRVAEGMLALLPPVGQTQTRAMPTPGVTRYIPVYTASSGTVGQWTAVLVWHGVGRSVIANRS